jgi:hypothetical protein
VEVNLVGGGEGKRKTHGYFRVYNQSGIITGDLTGVAPSSVSGSQ